MVQSLNVAIKGEAGLWSLAGAKHLSGVVVVPNLAVRGDGLQWN
jgi:hypothetical protein